MTRARVDRIDRWAAGHLHIETTPLELRSERGEDGTTKVRASVGMRVVWDKQPGRVGRWALGRLIRRHGEDAFTRRGGADG